MLSSIFIIVSMGLLALSYTVVQDTDLRLIINIISTILSTVAFVIVFMKILKGRQNNDEK